MSALASLVRAYDRMAERGEVPPFGYSQEKIGFVVSLYPDGTIAEAVKISLAGGVVAPVVEAADDAERRHRPCRDGDHPHTFIQPLRQHG